jgi:predicted DsbA family dithiol-disulfide isomerase
MQLDFWIDPARPWCWLTSRWVEDIAEDRELDIR